MQERCQHSTALRFCYSMTHSGPTIPEAASSRSSVKDTLFLSKPESEWVEKGGVVALAAEPEPGRDRVSVERMGELGQRKIPRLRPTDWGSSIRQRNGWKVHREKNRYIENRQERSNEDSGHRIDNRAW